MTSELAFAIGVLVGWFGACGTIAFGWWWNRKMLLAASRDAAK